MTESKKSRKGKLVLVLVLIVVSAIASTIYVQLNKYAAEIEQAKKALNIYKDVKQAKENFKIPNINNLEQVKVTSDAFTETNKNLVEAVRNKTSDLSLNAIQAKDKFIDSMPKRKEDAVGMVKNAALTYEQK